jgi:hypothetical protein
VPILLNLERVVDGAASNNFIVMIICSLIVFGGLLNMDIANKVCFRANGVTIFQGLKIGVTIQFMAKHNPYIVSIHCMAH